MGIFQVLEIMTCMVAALVSYQAVAFESFPRRPLCVSQFALVNHACKDLPYYPIVPSVPPAPDEPPVEPPPAPEDPESHRHRHRGSPPSPDYNHTHHSHHHQHHHPHHHHEPHHYQTPMEADCCRWLKEVDTECVCNILVRMPPFMSKPVHEYTVIVPEACIVEFLCEG